MMRNHNKRKTECCTEKMTLHAAQTTKNCSHLRPKQSILTQISTTTITEKRIEKKRKMKSFEPQKEIKNQKSKL